MCLTFHFILSSMDRGICQNKYFTVIWKYWVFISSHRKNSKLLLNAWKTEYMRCDKKSILPFIYSWTRWHRTLNLIVHVWIFPCLLLSLVAVTYQVFILVCTLYLSCFSFILPQLRGLSRESVRNFAINAATYKQKPSRRLQRLSLIML